ncbi:MAG: UbiD family decarboxylase [Dehalococcoidia bacterium]|nr:UbiD family decarboxylase [Dehalococcoidia bacterium]
MTAALPWVIIGAHPTRHDEEVPHSLVEPKLTGVVASTTQISASVAAPGLPGRAPASSGMCYNTPYSVPKGANVAFHDLREYIDKLEQEGELLRIKEEVDWDLELGGIVRLATETDSPAPLFEKIKGYPQGYRVLGAPVANYRRIAIAFGLPPDTSFEDLLAFYISRKKDLVKPILVNTGPCKEVIDIGEKADLLKFPAPMLHLGDGGRYIGTYHIIVTKDPDSGWVNWGLYRLMVHDSRTLGGLVTPLQHMGALYYDKFEPQDKPMEFAICFGTEPVSNLIASFGVPMGTNEADVAGALRGQPVELVKCETVDLEVPATSEIVIEGIMPPRERRDEGPFGEYTGFSGNIPRPMPVYKVTAITHRRDPILTACAAGVPIDDTQAPLAVAWSAELLEELRQREFPVRMVYVPPEYSNFLAAVSTKVPYANYPRKLADAIWASKPGTNIHYVAVFDEDVDVTNLTEVVHAIFTRCHPVRGIYKEPHMPGTQLEPYLSPLEKANKDSATCLFDCTWPKDWPAKNIPSKISFETSYPPELKQRILGNWLKYGFKSNKRQ